MSRVRDAGVRDAGGRRGNAPGASVGGDVIEGVWLSQPDAVGAWLDVLMGLVRLGSAEKRAIRDELDSHLRDRVRDLMLTGLHESNATREAIAELGDAAELAARYARASKSPARRRIAMNLGLFGMAGAALVTSLMALSGGGDPSHPEISVYAAPGQQRQAVPIGRVSVTGKPLEEVLRGVAQSAGKRLSVEWNSLAPLGLEPVTEVTLDVADGDLAQVFGAINAGTVRGEVASGIDHGGVMDYRIADGVLRVASAHVFDMEERVLVTIDLSAAQLRGVAEDEIHSLVTTFIEPDGWVDNGGEIAVMSIVGTKMFVKAPPRVIEGVRWIVRECGIDSSAITPSAESQQSAVRDGAPGR
ncbi:MAG: hypothetical protein KF902_11340 [Phycisphaeraceae bacterium]|nr:hypothetical protein [Phycisphaeraceae bacterium]